MREYGQIQSSFWQSEDAEAMSDQAKVLACYLLTGPYTNGLGCFRLTDGNIMDDLGWSYETVSETVSELSRIGFAYRFGKVIFIPNFLRWNRIANPKVAIARLSELEGLPTQDAKALAARVLLKFCGHLTEQQKTLLQTISETVSETVLQTLSKQNPTQSYPTQPNQTQVPTTSDADASTEPDPIWGAGLSFLRSKGVADRGARSFLGKLAKDVGQLRCVELLAKAESEDVAEPLAWLRAAAERTTKHPPVAEGKPDWQVGVI